MAPGDTFQNVYGAIHHTVTGGLLRLLDGLFQNLDVALHDIASRPGGQKQRCLILMREVKTKRSMLIHVVAEQMQAGFDTWIAQRNVEPATEDEEIAQAARGLAEKTSSHFGLLLQAITERSANAAGTDANGRTVPISPYHISAAFLHGCGQLGFDADDTAILTELFGRYVLERLGHIYGVCNHRLIEAGHLTQYELPSAAHA